ncbi:cation:proton antiporter regulatory subunit [Paenibacillus koleovorans]|uniref:cation:proton antiporter regulatory subunit n=1 Tax=Paenibacillus koleovorans TaxID=121608 RepID=UPI000FD8F629|nr:cation:proton antiporter regulatory subunit [Paenibacillus koleovorans]
MNIREIDLPGIGKKYQLLVRDGSKLVLVVHDDGRRECYHFESPEAQESLSSVTLDDDEARLVAGILGGMTYKPKALLPIEMALDELVLEWYRVEPDSACVGRTIGELNVRQRCGATILALLEKNNGTRQINPGPEVVLTADCTLVAAGERRQLLLFKSILKNGVE